MKGGWLKGWGTGGVTRSNHGMEVWMRGVREGMVRARRPPTHSPRGDGLSLMDGDKADPCPAVLNDLSSPLTPMGAASPWSTLRKTATRQIFRLRGTF